jgi:hypothetical protein
MATAGDISWQGPQGIFNISSLTGTTGDRRRAGYQTQLGPGTKRGPVKSGRCATSPST